MSAAEPAVADEALASRLTRFLDALHAASRGAGPWTPVLTSLVALGSGAGPTRRPLFEAALRHVRQALEVSSVPAGRAVCVADGNAVAGGLPCGLAVVDPRGQVLFASERASALLRGASALGAVRAAARRRSPEAVAGTGACLTVDAGSGQPALRLLLLRAAPATLVLMFEQCGEGSLHLLREVYGFSAAEAELTGLLLAGQDLAAAARSRRVTLNTVRSQLRGVLRKTGCRNQADLMRALMSGPAGLLLPR